MILLERRQGEALWIMKVYKIVSLFPVICLIPGRPASPGSLQLPCGATVPTGTRALYDIIRVLQRADFLSDHSIWCLQVPRNPKENRWRLS